MANYDEILRIIANYCEYINIHIFISIGIAIGIVWKSVTLRPGIPLGPSFTTGKNPIMLRMFGELRVFYLIANIRFASGCAMRREHRRPPIL